MPKKFAFVFPGQGSQSVGMLSDLAADYPLIVETFAQASEVLGYDLWKLVCEGPAEILHKTEYTQPALLAADVALWRVFCATQDTRPSVLVGHSLGEFAAFVCAGAMDYVTAVKLVAARGRFMQEAVPVGEGAMAAIVGLTDDSVSALCARAAQGEVVAPANFNSLGQVVIAGQTAAVERAVQLAKQDGAKLAKVLPVSVPSHCALMQPAAAQLEALLAHIEIAVPAIAVIQNVDAAIHMDPVIIRHNLVAQLVCPVRFVESVQAIQQQGIIDIVECGPGNVLQGLIKRISKELTVGNVTLNLMHH